MGLVCGYTATRWGFRLGASERYRGVNARRRGARSGRLYIVQSTENGARVFIVSEAGIVWDAVTTRIVLFWIGLH